MTGTGQGVAGRRLLPKTPTGVAGLDQVTEGGLPRGRATLVCGPAGSGKTLLAMEFLVRGVGEFGEPGVFMSFEETPGDLVANVASLGFDLADLVEKNLLVVDHINISGEKLRDGGEWDLEGLFLRLGAAIAAVGARRVVIDTIENLFTALPNTVVLRSELHRLFRWLKARGVTTVITGERGEGTLTRNGIEEYVSDCVIVLDHRVVEQSSTRRLRIVKYRGSLHGTNEYPFLIGRDGVSVVPITALNLDHQVSTERVSTGVPALDDMLGGGYFKGSSVLVGGAAGTGKSTLAAHFCAAACARGERAMYFAFEESEVEIIRNMASVGIDLAAAAQSGALRFHCTRPGRLGLEEHLLAMQQTVAEFAPAVVVVDPVSILLRIGTETDVIAMITRQLDFLKGLGVTAVFTTLAGEGSDAAGTGLMSSLVDAWLAVKLREGDGEFERQLYIRKARGIAHSHQIREFTLTDRGVKLTPVYHGPDEVLTGSPRRSEQARDVTRRTTRKTDAARRQRELAQLHHTITAQTAQLWRDYQQQADAVDHLDDAVDDEPPHADQPPRQRSQ